MYSASAEECETVFCFLARQLTNDAPKKIQNPIIERRLSIHDAHPASQ